MSDHMFNEDGICDCTECWPTNTPPPNREKTMKLEVGTTYHKGRSEEGWRKTVNATDGALIEAWWASLGEEFGRRGRVIREGRRLVVGGSTIQRSDGNPTPDLLRFTVLELPARLDPAKALVVRNRYGDLWSRTGDVWRPLTGQGGRDFDLDYPPTYSGTLTVVIDADGNVVDEGDR